MAAKKPEVKPGYQTTEFLGTAIVTAGLFFGLPIPPDQAAIVAGVMWTVYTAVRGWIKTR